MKRHDALLALSREHHAALRVALHARRAAATADRDALAAAAALCRTEFAATIDAHFRVEEETLPPLLEAAGRKELAARLAADHAALRRLVAALVDAQAATLAEFADLLAAHVRFEERELFPAVEALLDA